MNTFWVRAGVVTLVSCLALVSCDDNPVNENRGDPVSLIVNPSFAVVDAADTTQVNANALDQYGELTFGQVQFSTCDNKITLAKDPTVVALEPPDRVIVVGQTLGESCVVASGPGGLVDTATVEVLPAEVVVDLQPILQSGQSAQAALSFLDASGAAVTGFDASQVDFSVADPSIADVDEAGNVSGKAPGSTEIVAALTSDWALSRETSDAFTVVPSAFDGTVSPTTADWGDTITVSAGAVAFDGDTGLEFDGLAPYVVSQSASQFVVVGPAGMGSSPAELLVLRVGANQLAYSTTIEVPNPDPADAFEPNNGGGGGGLTLSDLSATTPASLPFAEWISTGALDLDDVFEITLGATTTVNFSIDWNFEDADLDVLFYDGAGDLIFDFGCASTAVPEVCSVTLDAGTYYIDVNVFDAHGHDWVTVLFEMS